MISMEVLKPINPILFQRYEEYQDLLQKTLFFYTEQRPRPPTLLEFQGQTYELGESLLIELPGHVTHPDRALQKCFTASYQKNDLLEMCQLYQGILFVYDGYTSTSTEISSEEAVAEIKYLVFPFKANTALDTTY